MSTRSLWVCACLTVACGDDGSSTESMGPSTSSATNTQTATDESSDTGAEPGCNNPLPPGVTLGLVHSPPTQSGIIRDSCTLSSESTLSGSSWVLEFDCDAGDSHGLTVDLAEDGSLPLVVGQSYEVELDFASSFNGDWHTLRVRQGGPLLFASFKGSSADDPPPDVRADVDDFDVSVDRFACLPVDVDGCSFDELELAIVVATATGNLRLGPTQRRGTIESAEGVYEVRSGATTYWPCMDDRSPPLSLLIWPG